MFRQRVLFVCALAGLLLGVSRTAFPQEITTGTLAGIITDEKGKPIGDAIITAKSPQGARKALSDKNGFFIIPFLTPGAYSVQVVAAGYATLIQDDILVKLNEKTTLRYAMQPGKVETVTVTGQAPLVDRASTSIGNNVKVGDFTASLPIGRTYSNLFTTAPGVVSGGGTGAGNFSIGGSSGLENSYLIDGVNITNTGYGGIGSYSITYGSLGTGVTSDFLDEVQVKTGGFEAEFGQALGGVLNAIVKSGTNELKGNLAFYGTLSDLEGSRERVRTELGFVNAREHDVYDFAFSYGGPLIKDKLFWFIAINPVETKTGFEAPSVVFPSCVGCTIDISDIAGKQAFPASQLGPQERTRRNYNYAGKLTWFPATNHRFDLTIFGDPSRGFKGPQNADLTSSNGVSSLLFADYADGGGQSGIRYGANNAALKYNGILTPRFFVDAQLSRHDGRFGETPLLNEYRIRDRRVQLLFNSAQTSVGPANFRGGPGFLSDSSDINTQLSVKLTNVLGKNELKYGAQFDKIEYTDNQHYSGPPFTAFLARSCSITTSLSCSSNKDCPAGACTLSSGQCHIDDDCLGACSISETSCVADPDCEVGACSTSATPCQLDSECPPAETCIGGGGSCAGFGGTCAGPAEICGAVFDKVPLQSTSGATIDQQGTPGDKDSFRAVRMRFYPAPPATTNNDAELFIQDTWQVSPRWTLKGGVRASHEKVEGSGKFTLPYEAATFCSVTDGIACTSDADCPAGETCDRVSGRKVGTTTFEHGSYTFDWAYGVRLGGVFDPVGNGKSKLYGNYGRYYQRIPNDLAVRSFSNEVGGKISYSDATKDVPLDPANQTSGVSGLGSGFTRVQPGTKLPYEDEYILGYQQQLRPDLAIEVRGIFRYQGRVLEDTQFTAQESTENYYYGFNYGYPCDPFPSPLRCSVTKSKTCQVDADCPASETCSKNVNCPGNSVGSFAPIPFSEYVLANPGQNTPKSAGFPSPKRDYKAFELTINKTYSNNWAMTANYKYSQLIGNYEGLFRNDNGQSDPNISSLFDFPNSPLMSAQFNPGFLNTDRTHVLNVYPYYRWHNGLTVGGGFNWQSGTPRQPYLAHPNSFYQNAGEIPGISPVYAWWEDTDGNGKASAGDTLVRGSSNDFFNDPIALSRIFLYDYRHVRRGFLGRSPDIVSIDVHVSYPFKFGDKSLLNLSLDIFNLVNNQEARSFDDNVESLAGITNPDFLTPNSFGPPRTMRFSVNWSF